MPPPLSARPMPIPSYPIQTFLMLLSLAIIHPNPTHLPRSSHHEL